MKLIAKSNHMVAMAAAIISLPVASKAAVIDESSRADFGLSPRMAMRAISNDLWLVQSGVETYYGC